MPLVADLPVAGHSQQVRLGPQLYEAAVAAFVRGHTPAILLSAASGMYSGSRPACQAIP